MFTQKIIKSVSLLSKKSLCKAVTLGTAVLMANNAHAAQLEEIVVTAQKREESLQAIPLAISAFGGDQLREDGVNSLEDIGSRTPGLTFSAFSPGQPEIAIRGVGTKEDGPAAGDSTVVSIDDVYIAARTAQVFDIFDLERVEVLRGPQGTLYGKNSIGGSINFVTSKPTEDFTARVRYTAGDFGRSDLGAMLSGGLSDTLFAKVSFSSRSHDGYLRHVLSGKQLGESDTLAWRTQLRWLPLDNLEVSFTADGADDELGHANREPIGSSGPFSGNNSGNPVAVNEALGGAGNPWTTLADVEGFLDREVAGYSVKVNWDLDNMTFTSITAYRESDFDWLEDSNGLPAPTPPINFTGLGSLFSLDVTDGYAIDVHDAAIEETEQLTQELRLTSNNDGQLSWVAGFFYSEEEISRTETYQFLGFGFGGGANDITEQFAPQSNESTSWAVYGQATYALTETINLTGGLRYSTEEKDIEAESVIVSGVPILLKPFDRVTASDSWDNVSGKLALDWSVAEDVLLYGSISTGFKSGGFTGSASTAAQASTPFDEETATNYEVGIKSQWFDRSLQLNITTFYTDYTDLQVTRFFTPVGTTFGQFITENAGEAELKGAELEFVWLPTDNVEVGGSYAYLEAEFVDFTGTPPAGGGGDFSGNKLRQAPENAASLYAKYTHALANDLGELSAKVTYRYQDHSFYDPDNNPITVIPQYRIIDALIAWNSTDGHWNITAWQKNMNNEKYRTHAVSQLGGRVAFGIFGDPRTTGVTVSYNY